MYERSQPSAKILSGEYVHLDEADFPVDLERSTQEMHPLTCTLAFQAQRNHSAGLAVKLTLR